MLAFMVAVMLSSTCAKDTDCKGDRVCTEGRCVDEAPPEPVYIPQQESAFAVPEKKPAPNPYRVHIWISMAGAIGSWALTALGSLIMGDVLFDTTVLPVVGPFVSYLRCTPENNCVLQPSGAALIAVSTVMQVGFFAYLLAAIIRTVNYDGT